MKTTAISEDTSFFESATSRWISENSTQGILVTDTDLTIRYCNRWIETQTGKKESDLLGRELFSVFPEIETRGLGHYYRHALTGEGRVLSHRLHKYLIAVPTKNGSPGVDRMQQSSRIGALVEGDEIVGTITIIDDVTERVARERELKIQLDERERLLASELAARRLAEENSRVKDEFLATVSHEIRAPLNAIRGWTLILRGKVDAETLTHALDTIDRNVVSQSQIIEDLLDVSRMVSGQMKLELRPVDLAESVESAIDSLSPAAAAKEIELVKRFEMSSAFVAADGVRLQQVLWNLISNAIKFTERKGTVEIVLREHQQFVELAVRDNGAGISPEFLPYVFDRFRQADGGMKRRHGGLGLGLSIVKNLVDMHGGTTSVESVGEGHGTSFIVRLPRLLIHKNDELLSPDEKAESVPSLRMLKCRILIVDDDKDSREMLHLLLSMRNAEVRAAGSAAEALSVFEDFKPDVLISDLGMPEMDGYDLITRVRSFSPENGGRVPAIALTGYVSVEEQRRVHASGFDNYIAKPLDHNVLIQTIGNLLDDVRN